MKQFGFATITTMIQPSHLMSYKNKPATQSGQVSRKVSVNTDAMRESLLCSLSLAVAAFFQESGSIAYSNTSFKTAFTSKIKSKLTLEVFEKEFLQLMMDGDAVRTQAGKPATPFTTDMQDMLHRPSGRWYSIQAANATVENKTLVILHLADITGRLETEQRKHSQRQQMLFTSKVMSVGEMAATLAHELNQPIGSLTNYLNGTLRYLDAHQETAPAILEPLRNAKKQAERAASIITRIRQFVRAREPKLHELVLDEVTASVLTLVEPESTKYGVQISVVTPKDLPTVRADRVMIEQVLHNLVKNAIEAMTDPSTLQKVITVTARPATQGQIEISVEDSGHGLPSQTSDHVFSPFFTTKADGLGIGLNICRSMIEYHGGSLFFKNNTNKAGSTFTFTLPQFAPV